MVEPYNATILGQWQEATSSFRELNPMWAKGPGSAGSVAKNALPQWWRLSQHALLYSGTTNRPISPRQKCLMARRMTEEQRDNPFFTYWSFTTMEFKPII